MCSSTPTASEAKRLLGALAIAALILLILVTLAEGARRHRYRAPPPKPVAAKPLVPIPYVKEVSWLLWEGWHPVPKAEELWPPPQEPEPPLFEVRVYGPGEAILPNEIDLACVKCANEPPLGQMILMGVLSALSALLALGVVKLAALL